MTTYYKAVRLDGTDFHTGASVSTVPTDCTGMEWPCRLLTVEPVEGYPVTTPDPDTMPHKRASVAWRVTGEADAHAALGPQGAQIAALIARAAAITEDEARRLDAAREELAARDASWDASWCAARDAARDAAPRRAAQDAARRAAWRASWEAARDAACALVARDLISTEHYDTLTTPWRTVIGPIHPDDPSLA